MKKILSFLALILLNAMTYAEVSITVSPTNVDFGVVSINGKEDVDGSMPITVTYSGLQPYCGVFIDEEEMPEDGAIFMFEGTKTVGYIYGGDENTEPEGPNFTLSYLADKAGIYTGKLRFYTYADEYWAVESESVYLTIRLEVTDEELPSGQILPSTDTPTRVSKILRNGELLIIRNSEPYTMTGVKK